MKLLQLAISFGGVAGAIAAFAPPGVVALGDQAIGQVNALQAMTTSTFLTTSVLTITKCGGPDATECPENGTAIVTSVVAITTTFCPVTGTPLVTDPISTLPSSKAFSVFNSTVDESFTLTIPIVLPPTPTAIGPVTSSSVNATSSSTLSDPVSVLPISSTVTVPTPVESSLSSSESSSIDLNLSTFTDGIPTSVNSHSSSAADTTAVDTVTHPHSPGTASTTTGATSLSSKASSYIWPSFNTSSLATTNTDAVPTSLSLSSGAVSSVSNASTTAQVSSTTANATSVILSTDASVSTSQYDPSSVSSASSVSTVALTTTKVTTTLFKTITAIVTATPKNSTFTMTTSLSNNATSLEVTLTGTGPATTDIEVFPTFNGTGFSSGFPLPTTNATNNGSFVVPTMPPWPINVGHQLAGAGRSSMMAIVVALAFAHFA